MTVEPARQQAKKLEQSILILAFSGELAQLDAHYRKVLTNRFAEKSITVVPLGEVPLDRLLDMAVKRIAPFQQKGERGFRDALIVFCMLAYAKQHGQSWVSLISADRVFKEESVVMLAKEYGVNLDVYGSVEGQKAQ